MSEMQLEKNPDFNGIMVPYLLIDDYLGDMDGDSVKVYLYLLRYTGRDNCFLSVPGMAQDLRLTEDRILQSFRSLEQLKLLVINWGSDTEIQTLKMISCQPRNRAKVSVEKKLEKYASRILQEAPSLWEPPAKMSHAPKDQYARKQQDEDFASVMYVAERYLGRHITPSDADSILYYHDSLGFSWELIEYLLDYCVSKGHRKFDYIDKVAIGWAKDRVVTVEDAKASSRSYSEGYYKLMKTFGIQGRSLAEPEMAYIAKWTDSYGFTTEIIIEACKRTILAVHSPSFEYADSILHGWKKQGIKTLNDITKADAAFRAKKTDKATPSGGETRRNNSAASSAGRAPVSRERNPGMQRDYTPSDIDELEAQLLSRARKNT